MKRGYTATVDPSRIVQLRINNPCMSMAWIANIVGLSRERVRQVLNEHGEDTRAQRSPRKWNLCPVCGKVKPKRKRFCNIKCRRAASRVNILCKQCGKMKEVLVSQVMSYVGTQHENTRLLYCSRECFYDYIRENPELHWRRKSEQIKK